MFYQSLQYTHNLMIFKVEFSIRFRLLVSMKKPGLKELIRIQQIILKAIKQLHVATLFPLFCKLKSLCRGELIDWYKASDIIPCCSSVYHLLLGVMIYLWTINSYFHVFLYYWLHQFVQIIAFVSGFEDIPELQEICLTNKVDSLSFCWKAELKADIATVPSV